MSTRRILHQLVDELPEEDISIAERVLQALLATSPAPHVPLEEAPLGTEPDDDDFDGGLAEARADAQAGRVKVPPVAYRAGGFMAEALTMHLGEDLARRLDDRAHSVAPRSRRRSGSSFGTR